MLKRCRTLAAVFALCACVISVQAEERIALRVMSYNVHHGAAIADRSIADNMVVQAKILREQNPDLVALQEIDNRCRRSGSVDQTQRYAQLTRLNGRFGRFMDYDGGQYGLAVLSRFPVDEVKLLDLPPGRAEPRIALILTAEVAEGVNVLFVNVHFDWYAKSKERVLQARKLVEHLKESDLPIIVAGDYNAQRNSPTLEVFEEAGFEYVGKRGSAFTFDAKNPSIEIDHVFIRDGAKMKISTEKITVLEETVASDHRPIVTTVYLEREKVE